MWTTQTASRTRRWSNELSILVYSNAIVNWSSMQIQPPPACREHNSYWHVGALQHNTT